VTEDTSGAFDALNPLSSGETQTDEIIADRRRRVVKSGDLVAGKKRGEEWRTRTVGTEAQIGTHYPQEPHGDKDDLPRGLQVAVSPIPVSPSVPTGKKYAGFDVQYVDQAITDKKGNKFMGMNYRQAEEMGIYFPYSEDTILIDKSLSSEEREQTLEMQVRIIAKMKTGASYLEAHAQVRTEMPERVPKKAGFWDSAKALGISAMQRYRKSIEADTAKREKDKLFSDVSKMGLEDGIKAVDEELPLIEAKSYSKAVKGKVKAGKVKTVRT
jgi:hypothetical protein